jgi:protein-S-isoprenylcysteine O-methyltransferase Ste14
MSPSLIHDLAGAVCQAGACIRLVGSVGLIVMQALKPSQPLTAKGPLRPIDVAGGLEPLAMLLAVAWIAVHHPQHVVGLQQMIVGVAGMNVTISALLLMLWAVAGGPVVVGRRLPRGFVLRTNGAYGRVRHPLYLGVLGLWLGLSAAAHSIPLLALTVGLISPTLAALSRAEEATLCEAFGAQYASYRRRVPRWIPRVAKLRAGTAGTPTREHPAIDER